MALHVTLHFISAVVDSVQQTVDENLYLLFEGDGVDEKEIKNGSPVILSLKLVFSPFLFFFFLGRDSQELFCS
jgi:hypothetical protein